MKKFIEIFAWDEISSRDAKDYLGMIKMIKDEIFQGSKGTIRQFWDLEEFLR